ncbi:MAG: OmpA family protein [Elusimicrobia bacterium]|nr:OmpA family protein [Elusimicrobiota bacterium]
MAVYRFRKEELEGHLNRNALWAIVYGDMMSYLMILFLLLLSTALMKNVKKEDRPEVEKSLMEIQVVFGGKVDKAYEEKRSRDEKFFKISEALKGMQSANVSVIATEKLVRVQLGEGVLFDSGSAELKESAAPLLEPIAKQMLVPDNQIRVEGHTDTVPIRKGKYKSNWELSMARAYSVVRTLEGMGVKPERLSGIGYGEYRPVAANDTPENKAKNRRIEINLLRSE